MNTKDSTNLSLGFAPKVYCSKVYRTNQLFCYDRLHAKFSSCLAFFAFLFLVPLLNWSILPFFALFPVLPTVHKCHLGVSCPFLLSRVSCYTGDCSTSPGALSFSDWQSVDGSWSESAAWRESAEWELGKEELYPGHGITPPRDLLRSSSQRNGSYHLPGYY